MSKYTTEIRYICENYAGLSQSQGQTSVNDIIAKAAPKIFNFSFPIFDESNRLPLETKILRYYYTREIGFETVGLWQLKLDTKMNEIMPIANALYEALAEKFNILDDVNYYRESGEEDTSSRNTSNGIKENIARENNVKDNRTEGEQVDEKTTRNLTAGEQVDDKTTRNLTAGEQVDESTKSDSSGNSQTINKYSATPQGGLTGILSDEYLTNATVDTGEAANNDKFTRDLSTTKTDGGTIERDMSSTKTDGGTVERDMSSTITKGGTVNSSGTEGRERQDVGSDNVHGTKNGLEWVHGKMNSGKTYAQVLNEWKEANINVDMMIIESLSDLFMNIW